MAGGVYADHASLGNYAGYASDLMTGGVVGSQGIDFSAAETGAYTGDDNKWHSKVSMNTYSWLIIAGAVALLWFFGGVVFNDVNA